MYILHNGITKGQPYVVIATGFKSKSDNRKTGDMIQTWIILENVHPVEAVQAGMDATTICTGCPFASGKGCYVNVGQAPASIWKAYHRGAYTPLSPKDYGKTFAGRKVRFGSYGNPSLIPLAKMEAIAKASAGWTGYFHNWHDMPLATARAYNAFLMASTDTARSLAKAVRLGLRYFHVSTAKPTEAIECLSDSHGKQCSECLLCAGTAKPARPIWINPHGSGVKKAIAATA